MNRKELKIKKILVGICGIGNGHINRQICVIKELLRNNYEVLVATESCKIQAIKDTFKNVKVIELYIPMRYPQPNYYSVIENRIR